MSARRAARAALALATLAMGAVACTGTSESTAPYLLVVGLDDPAASPAGPQLALVEDSYSPIASTTQRFDLLEASRRALPYPAVAADVTERAGARGQLVVLTRDLGGGTAPASDLRFFDLEGIDPNDPVAFAPSTSPPTIVLTGSGGALEGLPGVGGDPCPSAVQASRDGSQVVILDDRAACSGNAGDPAYLYLLDTSTGTAQVITPTGPLLPAAPYLDQGTIEEHLYFLAAGVANAQLYRLTLPDGSAGWFEKLALPGQDQRTLTATAGELVALRPNQIDALDPTANAQAATAATVADAAHLAVDPTGATTQLIVVGDSQVAVHADPTDAQAVKLNITGEAAAIDPINRFAYVVRDGVIAVIDLLQIEGGGSGSRYLEFPVTGIALPQDGTGQAVGVLSWTRVAATP